MALFGLVVRARARARALKRPLFSPLSAEGEIMSLFVLLAPAILFIVTQGDMGKSAETDELLFTPVPLSRNSSRVLPFEVVLFPGTDKKLCSD